MIEGDIAGSIDAQRMDALGVPVVQINTEGACHLDASMVAAAAPALLGDEGARGWGLETREEGFRVQGSGEVQASVGASSLAPSPRPLAPGPRLLVIENVGNLVCTAGFDLGEHLRIVILSVSEGDDKLVKYPAIFQSSQALVVSKIDLLPHTNFRIERVTADMKRLAPTAEVFQVSALRGEGVSALADWLLSRAANSRSPLLQGEG